MKYLLDTHVVDWAQTDVAKLSPAALGILKEARPGDLAVSDVSLSELARHLATGRIVTRLSPEKWLKAAITGIEVLPVTSEIAVQAAMLEWGNRDPCDRHIVATAAAHRLPLMTVDTKIHALTGVRGLRVVW